jgi:hypothetical protein
MYMNIFKTIITVKTRVLFSSLRCDKSFRKSLFILNLQYNIPVYYFYFHSASPIDLIPSIKKKFTQTFLTLFFLF